MITKDGLSATEIEIEDDEDETEEMGEDEGTEMDDAGDGGELVARGKGSPNHRPKKSSKPKKAKAAKGLSKGKMMKYQKKMRGTADMPTPRAGGMRLSELGAKLNASHAAAAGHALPSTPMGMIGAGVDLGHLAAALPAGLSASDVTAATGLSAGDIATAVGLIGK